jgi:hypothetical protein
MTARTGHRGQERWGQVCCRRSVEQTPAGQLGHDSRCRTSGIETSRTGQPRRRAGRDGQDSTTRAGKRGQGGQNMAVRTRQCNVVWKTYIFTNIPNVRTQFCKMFAEINFFVNNL